MVCLIPWTSNGVIPMRHGLNLWLFPLKDFITSKKKNWVVLTIKWSLLCNQRKKQSPCMKLASIETIHDPYYSYKIPHKYSLKLLGFNLALHLKYIGVTYALELNLFLNGCRSCNMSILCVTYQPYFLFLVIGFFTSQHYSNF